MDIDRLKSFVDWVRQHIRGDEKSEAQIFLDHLFQSFGHPGCLDIGGQTECRLRKAAEDGGGIAFADFIWKPVVLIEMKKRGAELHKHFRQAFDYWVRSVPNRPRFVVLCNFDEFQIYDFETQMDSPVDTIRLENLPEQYEALQFIAPNHPEPIFNNNRVAVTRQAADCLGDCFNHIVDRKIDRGIAQRFILQMLLSLFAEDIGLLPKNIVTQLLDDCQKPEDSYDLIGGLFRAMNTNPPVTGGRYKGVQFFNGGLFANPASLELTQEEIQFLRLASQEDWSKVQPEIFGTLFQHSLDAKHRHAFGAHFTHPVDIMKIVGPTIVEPWREQVEEAKTRRRLNELLDRLQNYRVLDPACGSGNFLYVAYRELKRIEARLFERLDEFKSEAKLGPRLSYFSVQNFYGLDIIPFAIEIAKVTMMIARQLAVNEIHFNENTLPLDNLDAHFRATDALLQSDGSPTPWPEVDVIIGNPPYLGAKFQKPEYGPDYVNRLRRAYPYIPGMSDYCVYWFRKAHDLLPPCTLEDPVAGRAGLVGTQNIRNNKSRVGGLDHIVKSGTIVEAVDNQPWSGEAKVNVSIVNWVKTQNSVVLQRRKRLWFKADTPPWQKLKRSGKTPTKKEFELTYKDVEFINSALSDKADVSLAKTLVCNVKPKRVYQGVTPGHMGFVLNTSERENIVRDGVSIQVVHAYLTGRELVTGDGTPKRFIIDFQRRNLLEVQEFPLAFDRIKTLVLPDRARKVDEGKDANGTIRPHHRGFLKHWWALSWDRQELFTDLKALRGRFIACSRVTKRPIFVFLAADIWPSDKIQVFLFDDDYSFGILQSSVHWQWFLAKCAKLKSDFSYSIENVFNTFPWPQSPTEAQISAVARAGLEIRRKRKESNIKVVGGLRALYRTLELPGINPLKDAHSDLDEAVLEAYGFSMKKDILAQTLELNINIANRIERGENVTPPGIPNSISDKAVLLSDDCIQMH
ncbi:MAG TPA: N-6 DNA methylase [Acidobacteriota bacterium]|nr:N-6 DNA methylase [Acidobacteriota bacterium]